jgi:hypothetical protein
MSRRWLPGVIRRYLGQLVRENRRIANNHYGIVARGQVARFYVKNTRSIMVINLTAIGIESPTSGKATFQGSNIVLIMTEAAAHAPPGPALTTSFYREHHHRG